MATNMRAYRDGNRMVVVIENPTSDLERIVAGLISGEISTVKGLDAPKPMAAPKVDVEKMEEITPKEASASDAPRKALFVKNLEKAKEDTPKEAKPNEETAPNAAQVETTEAKPMALNLSREAMLRIVRQNSRAPLVMQSLTKKYKNANYPIDKLSDNELKWLIETLRSVQK